jgi:hypothetical protein
MQSSTYVHDHVLNMVKRHCRAQKDNGLEWAWQLVRSAGAVSSRFIEGTPPVTRAGTKSEQLHLQAR